MVKKNAYWVWIVFGIVLILTGIGSFAPAWNMYVPIVIAITASIILLMQVNLKKLFNRKRDSGDVMDAISLVLGIIVLVVSILSLFQISVYSFLVTLNSFAIILVGAFILAEGARM